MKEKVARCRVQQM